MCHAIPLHEHLRDAATARHDYRCRKHSDVHYCSVTHSLALCEIDQLMNILIYDMETLEFCWERKHCGDKLKHVVNTSAPQSKNAVCAF